MYSQLLGTLRTKFLTTDLTARLQPVAATANGADPTSAHDPGQTARLQSELVAWAKGQLAEATGRQRAEFADGAERGSARLVDAGAVLDGAARSAARPIAAIGIIFFRSQPARIHGSNRVGPGAACRADYRAVGGWGRFTAQLSSSDVAQCGRRRPPFKFMIATWSRRPTKGSSSSINTPCTSAMLYETIREKVLSGAMESQQLLAPEPVDLSPSESAAALCASRSPRAARVGD